VFAEINTQATVRQIGKARATIAAPSSTNVKPPTVEDDEDDLPMKIADLEQMTKDLNCKLVVVRVANK